MSTSAQTLVVPHLKEILFATDFSPCSQAAIPLLRALALCCGSTVHVVHVVPPIVGTARRLGMVPELEKEHWEADRAMQALIAGGEFSEISCTSAVEMGEVGPVLNNLAAELHVGLIVLGTHGRRGIKKLVLGSTAEQIVRTAPCPVLTIGPKVSAKVSEDTKAQAPLGPIIVAVDLDEWPHPALSFAASLARANHVPLILVHAVPLTLNVPEANLDAIAFTPSFSFELTERTLATSRRHMEEMISAEPFADLKSQMVVETAQPADLIVRTAEERQAGMIVMGAHRTGMDAVATHIPGATASTVLCEAPCPVITIRTYRTAE